MQENNYNNNNVYLTGIIESDFEFNHKVYGEGFYKFLLHISRLSNIKDIIPVIISERLINSQKLQKGDNIEIEGQFRSYNNFTNEGNKLVLSVFAKNIKIVKDINNIKNPNMIILNGYICKKPIYRTTPFGREIADILIAVNRAYNKSDYIPCIAWGRNAKFCEELNIGDNIKLWGRIQSREYQKKLTEGDVMNKTAYEVSINKMEFSKINEGV